MQAISVIFKNNLAPADAEIMYRHTEKQLEFEGFDLPFSGQLSTDNRWVRLAKMIPWHQFEDEYCATLSKKGQGPPAFSVRMALAALIIKERLGLSDEECVEQIREKTEKIIDVLHQSRGKGHKKPRTYRIKARKAYLAVAKSKKVSAGKLRKALRSQLGYLRRNLKSIGKLSRFVNLTVLGKKQYGDLLVISEVYRQQQLMYDQHSRRVDDRIVSISQPHVRPIKRGKAGSDTEFGAKLSVSMAGGFAFVDRTSWDNFNECQDLQAQVEAYKRRFGVYPESVHADRIYRTRENLRYCRKHGIRLSGPRLGRPPRMTPENAARLKAEIALARQDERERIPIEGKFGQAKRRYGINRIMMKLSSTSETAIALCFLVMNLEKWLAAIFLCLFFKEHNPIHRLGIGSFCRTVTRYPFFNCSFSIHRCTQHLQCFTIFKGRWGK